MVGDIVLTCTGGPTPIANTATPILTANITVSFGANVTSRLLTYASLTPSLATTNTSEALLLIDEPGSGLSIGPPGYLGAQTNIGPGAPQTLCSAPAGTGIPASLLGAGAGGCQEYVYNSMLPGSDYVMSSSSTTYAAPYNVFAGVVNSNQVTWYGIPIMPPTSPGVARVFRMTNIRINASTWFNGGGSLGTQQVLASISISGSTSVPVNNPVQIAGFVQSGLSTSYRNVGNTGSQGAQNLNQCTGYSTSPLGIVRFSENFGTAFKTRVGATGTSNGQSSTPAGGQNIPGFIYNSESGFIFPAISGVNNGSVAGLADYGTRLKAVFNSVPSGVRIFVSTTNVVNLTGVAGSGPLLSSATSFAQLVLSETAIDGNGTVPSVPAGNYTGVSNTTTQLYGYAEISVVNNSATAVWEVINTNPASPENFDFGVWVTTTSNPATNTPTPGTATVNLSFAPTSALPVPASYSQASGTLTIPRFVDSSTASSIFNIVQCTTSLLFPFITNQVGFDTGVAILNTTSDPFGTKPQAGTCAFNFYGQNAPPQFVTPSIPSGNNIAPAGNWAFMASTIAPNFEGYMIAVCNFQLAHGYAFVSDLGSQKLAHGYLALILTNAITSTRSGNPEQLEN
jgi:hypothetical protein